MLVKKFTVGQLETNCYLIENDGHCCIIDPGDAGQLIIEYIQFNNLSCDMVLATHGHFDHLLSVLEITSAYNIPFALSKKDDFLRRSSQRSAKFFLGSNTDPVPTIDIDLYTKKTIMLSGIKFEVIKTPGHTPGSISLYNKNTNALFCGDLLFKNGGVGRYDFSYSDKIILERSINKILKLPQKTQVYSGHGEEFSLSEFRKYYKMNN